jgi:hypothetical protein
MAAKVSKYFIGTLKAEDFSSDEVKSALDSVCNNYVFQKEQGSENGYEHYQICLNTKNSTTIFVLRNKLVAVNPKWDVVYLEAARSSYAVEHYCSKSDTYVEGTRVFSSPEYEQKIKNKYNNNLSKNNNSSEKVTFKMMDDYFNKNVSAHGTDWFISPFCEHACFFKQHKSFYELSCKGYFDTLALANRSTYKKVYYIHGSTGCGKSTLIRALFPSYKNCFFFADSERWFANGYKCESIGIFDDTPLPSISTFLTMTNPQPFNFDVKGSIVASCLNTIIILSNLSPEQYFDFYRLDSKQIGAIKRRLTHSWDFTTPLPEGYLFENDKDLSIYLSDETRRTAYETIRKEIQND